MSLVLNQLHYHGIINFIRKCYEKLILDRKRFTSTNKTCQGYVNSMHFKTPLIVHSTKLYTILYLTHLFYPNSRGGTERFILNMASKAKKKGHTVKVMSIGTEKLSLYDKNIGNIFYREFNIHDINVIEFRYKTTPVGIFYKNIDIHNSDLYNFAAFILKNESPDGIHCAYPQPMAAFLKCCIDENIPYIVTLTDFNIFCHYATLVDRKNQHCQLSDGGKKCLKLCGTPTIKNPNKRYENSKYLLENAKYITTPSQFVASIIHDNYPSIIPYVIPHGIDENFTLAHKTASNTFAYIGTLSPLKGVPLLIKAFITMDDKYTLNIYGSGNNIYVNSLKKIAKSNGNIKFHGSVPHNEVSKIYKDNDCIIVPSLWPETYNLVAREALASGCKVIASDIGALNELRKYKNFYPFATGKAESLIKAITQPMDNDEREIYLPVKISDEADTYLTLYNVGG